jgi:hypothetical protein
MSGREVLFGSCCVRGRNKVSNVEPVYRPIAGSGVLEVKAGLFFQMEV